MKRELVGKSIWDLFDKGSLARPAGCFRARVEVSTQSSHLWSYTGIQRELQTEIYSKWHRVFPLVCPDEISLEKLKLSHLLRLFKAVKDATFKNIKNFKNNYIYWIAWDRNTLELYFIVKLRASRASPNFTISQFISPDIVFRNDNKETLPIL